MTNYVFIDVENRFPAVAEMQELLDQAPQSASVRIEQVGFSTMRASAVWDAEIVQAEIIAIVRDAS